LDNRHNRPAHHSGNCVVCRTVQLHHIQVNLGVADVYWWRWEPSGIYFRRSAYMIMFAGQSPVLGAAQLWKSKVPVKCWFFMWTLLLGRCWTVERRRRHGLCSSAECALCSQEDETINHLFLQCTFSREVWFRALNNCGWGHLVLEPNDRLVDWWVATRKRVPKPRHRAFDSMMIGVT
jgi:hypothetical protein